MLAGRTLLKKLKNKNKYVLTVPLLTGLDGRKMSKTYNNYIALTDSPHDVYGKTMKLKDELIIDWFRLLTDLDDDQINTIKHQIAAGELNPMQAKKQLAFLITSWLYDDSQAKQAQAHFEQVFQRRRLPQTMQVVNLPAGRYRLIDLVKQLPTNLSSSQLKNLIKQKGVKLNQQAVTDLNQLIKLTADSRLVVQVGKFKHFQVRVK